MKIFLHLTMLAIALSLGGGAVAEDSDRDVPANEKAPRRVADEPERRKDPGLTPEDQSGTPEDVALTRKIRKELAGQKGLSMNARNVKIITINGRVTLRGAVNSEDEKKTIAEIARRNCDRGQLDNQLEIKSQ